jgi:epoxyqueuosine reductase
MSVMEKIKNLSQTGEILVGIAPIERFEGLSPEVHPASILPGARSVIVVAVEIGRGNFRGLEEGTVWGPSSRWEYGKPVEIAAIVESEGWDCVPYAPSFDAPMPRRAVREGSPVPNVVIPVEYAAVAAGLGEIGYCGLFMTRQFGTRQALGLAITDAELPAGEMSMEPICTKCKQCAKACPMGALSVTESMTLTILGKEMEIGLINENACKVCPNGVYPDSNLLPGWEELYLKVRNNQLVSFSQPVGSLSALNRIKASCGRACIAEFTNDDMRGYSHPFRIREPWGLRPEEMEDYDDYK